MRADKKKNLAKVAGAIGKDPTASERDIAKMAGVSNGTVNNMKKDLEHNLSIKQDPRVIAIAKKDLEIVDKIQMVTSLSLDQIAEKVVAGQGISSGEIAQLSMAGEKSQKRHAFYQGENSDEKGGEKADISGLVGDELASALLERMKK